MAINITDADAYITANTLDNEDWQSLDDQRKTAFLNVAQRVLGERFPDVDALPDEAVYLFANNLAWAYNDTNKYARQGVASFSVKGISFTFKDVAGRTKVAADFIPDSVFVMLGAPKRQVKRTLL